MSKFKANPTTAELVKTTPSLQERFRPVTTGQIHSTDNSFNTEGLFSTEIFGKVGSQERNELFGRIDFNTQILNPFVYKIICGLGSLYERIMDGKEYVEFDPKTKDFFISNGPKAKTGYHFFISKLKELKFKETGSLKRSENIKFIYRAIENGTALVTFMPVLPAGMRDYIDNGVGRPEEDEINTYYRKLISRASLVDPKRVKTMPEIYDSNIIGMQKAALELDRYIDELLKGKGKLIQGKWASRKIFNTTSNVISAHVDNTTGINDPRTFKYNDSLMGVYQFLRSAAPLTTYNVKNTYISRIFAKGANTAFLTNTKTLKRDEVSVAGIQREIDIWTTNDGIEKIFSTIHNEDVANSVVTFKGTDINGSKGEYCLGLLYRDEETFRFFQDIDEVPPELDRAKVKPITLFEFIYISIYKMSGKYPGVLTRYPVSTYGSAYPSMIVIVTTIDSQSLRQLDADWRPMEGEDNLAVHFPVLGSQYIKTLIPNPVHLGRLGGDYDGDTMHAKMVLSDEAVREVKEFLTRRDYYISENNELYFDVGTDVINTVFRTLS